LSAGHRGSRPGCARGLDGAHRGAHHELPHVWRSAMSHHGVPIAIAIAFTLVACGKVQEKVAEKTVEKAIESSLSKDGTQAKVNMSEGGMKVTTTDASGKSTQMEMGNAKISEAELGLPFYPGATPTEGSSMRIVSGNNTSMQVGLHSDDAPDKVAAFYRDKLKGMSDGKQLMDMSSNDGASLSLLDDKAKSTLQVHVSKAEKGSDVAIVATREAAK
jgi:hypothetical protein